MRSTIIAAAFAAGALAVPYSKRALVTDYQIDIVTKLVTVTADFAAPTPASNFVQQHNVVDVDPTPTPEATIEETTDDSSSESSDSVEAPQPTPDQDTGSYVPSGPTSGSYSDAILYHHNVHRANHSASDLTWDQGLADIASTIGSSCKFEHQMGVNGAEYGQNIASGPAPEDVGKVISNMFYNGELGAFDGLYGIPDPTGDNFAAWGHFSQIVWKGTSVVGCATVDCSAGGLQDGGGADWFTVCNYGSPGNFAGSFDSNVGEPLGHPTVAL